MTEWIVQRNQLFLLIIIIGIFAVYLIVKKIKSNNTPNESPFRDARSELDPNDTNYNMATYERDEIENMSKEELRSLLKAIQEGNRTSLGQRDFEYIRKKLEES